MNGYRKPAWSSPSWRRTARHRGGVIDRNKGLGALRSVSVWGSEYGLSLRQVACAEKSNEITAIPELLRLVDVKGAIVTIDAIGTEVGADYVLALKGNQGALHQAVIEYIAEQLEGDLSDAHKRVTTEKGHGREETWTYLQLAAPEELPGFPRWRGLKSIGLTTSCCLQDGKETIELRYHISRLKMDVRENFAWLNRFALSLLRQHPGRQSLVMNRRSCGWSDVFWMEVVTGSTR